MDAAASPVTERERPAVFAAAAAYFALLAGYYMLRSLREAFALEVGRERIGELFYLTFFVMLVILPVYWFAVARTPRRALLTRVYAFVIALFLALASAMSFRRGDPAIAAVYFVAVTSLNLFMVTVFWSVMVDAWRSGAAKRVFGFIAAGGSAGALVGPLFNSMFVERLGPVIVIYIACGLLAIAIWCGRIAQMRCLGADGDPGARLNVAVGGRARDDLKRLVTSPYLLGIAGLIVAGQILGGFMYNEQAKYVEAAYQTLESRAALFARIDFGVNVLSLLFQGVVVGWLTARGGVKLALGLIPLLLIGSLVVLALVPVGAVLLATQVLRRGVDYGLFKPTREMLFTVLNPESKFKSKSLLDTLLQRGGDSAGQLTYPLISGLGLAGVAWVCVGVCVVMLGVAVSLARGFEREDRSTLPASDSG